MDSPDWALTNKPSLSAASGATIEMMALREARGPDSDSTGGVLKSNSKTFYGLVIPELKPTTSSISITVGSDGVKTTVGESTLKLIPPDQQFLQNQGMEAIAMRTVPPRMSAASRNFFGL